MGQCSFPWHCLRAKKTTALLLCAPHTAISSQFSGVMLCACVHVWLKYGYSCFCWADKKPKNSRRRPPRTSRSFSMVRDQATVPYAITNHAMTRLILNISSTLSNTMTSPGPPGVLRSERVSASRVVSFARSIISINVLYESITPTIFQFNQTINLPQSALRLVNKIFWTPKKIQIDQHTHTQHNGHCFLRQLTTRANSMYILNRIIHSYRSHYHNSYCYYYHHR